MHWSFIPDKLFIRNFSLLFFFLQSNNDDLVKKMLCEASHSFRTWQLSIHFQSFNKSQMPASLTDQVRVLACDWMIHWRGHVGGGGGGSQLNCIPLRMQLEYTFIVSFWFYVMDLLCKTFESCFRGSERFSEPVCSPHLGKSEFSFCWANFSKSNYK